MLRAYHALPPAEQAAFAGMLRAHQLFNSDVWRNEISRRHQLLDCTRGLPMDRIEKLVKSLEPHV